MSDKEIVLETVRKLPEDVSWERIEEELAILAAIRQGKQDADAGRVFSHEEMKRRVNAWTTK